MPLRLNLGCGRAQFPTTEDNPFTHHLNAYLPDSAFDDEAGWLNVDSKPVLGVQAIVNLFAYPWMRSNGNPFSSDSVDEIWASHIVEHIPHEACLLPGASHFPDLIKSAEIDGWYAFFYECWRVLKPGGVLHIVCPTAFSTSGVGDPQHRRLVVPASFSYFKRNPDAPFDYGLPYEFEAQNDAMMGLIDDALEMYKALQIEADIAKKTALLHQLQAYITTHINACNEMYLALTPIKEKGD